MYRFIERIRNFMYGRYGLDKLGRFSFGLYVLVAIINIFIRNIITKRIFFTIQWVLLLIIILRILSRNITARRKENDAFERLFVRVEPSIKLMFERIKNIGSKRYRRCPNCKAVSRLPIKRGRHFVKCPKCKIEYRVFIIL